MLMYGFLGLIALFSLIALSNWRRGVLLIIVVAALQDPVRKLIPGTPGWLALATAPIIAALIMGSRFGTRHWWELFQQHQPMIAKCLMLFAVMCLPAAGISATYGPGSWMLTVLGVFSYSILFLTIIAGFHYARRAEDIRGLLAAYCIVHGTMLSGAWIEYLGLAPGWHAIGSDAFGFAWRRDVWGYVIRFISGFYRSGDVMGWHAAAVTCLSMTLALNTRGRTRLSWAGVAGWAFIALLLCGRRKMVYMLPVFLVAALWLYWQAGRTGRLIALIGVLALPVGTVVMVGDWLKEDATQVRYYTETSDQTLDSFRSQGFRAIYDTYDQAGFFGSGLGVATPGSHHLKVARPRVWQESAPSRIMVELGVLGGVALVFVMLAILGALWRVTREQIRAHSASGSYAAGLMAFFLANVGSLTVSGQILADPFIASFLGFLVGVALSCERQHLSIRPPPPTTQFAKPAWKTRTA
jgi:hypothetical protein